MMTAPEQLDALRNSCGVAPLTAGWIAVTGDDRVRWLNGMVSNSVKDLTPGEGAYTFLLSAQGRIQGDGTVWATAGQLLIQTGREQVEPMMALLDRFIIMDDVELVDQSAEWHGLSVAGPKAAALLADAGVPARASRLLKMSTVAFDGAELSVISAFSPLVPRLEVWSREEAAVQRLRAKLLDAGARECDADGLELLRVLEGTPRYGTDIRDRDLPQETAQTRALHFNKGCYLGQEIVERIRSRGNVHRTFTTFAVSGDVPAPGAVLEADGKTVGELTSVASDEIDGRRLALGFIRRQAVDRGLAITFPGGSAEPLAATEAANAAS